MVRSQSAQAFREIAPDSDSSLPMRSNPAKQTSAPKKLRSQNQLLSQITSFKMAFDHLSSGVSMFDRNGSLILCNAAYSATYGIPADLTVPGTHFQSIVEWHIRQFKHAYTSSDTSGIEEWIANHKVKLAQGEAWSIVQILPDGRSLRLTYHPLPDGGWVDMQEDITERRQIRAKIEWMAHHDALTGLANRYAFQERLQLLLGATDHQRFTIFWIDLDHFKRINDTLGHPCGDLLLKHVANRLFSVARATDFVARLGGDEFALIYTGQCSPASTEQMANRMISAIREPLQIAGNTLQVSASVGVLHVPEPGRSVETILQNVDVALYKAKLGGRNRYSVFDPESDEKHSQHYVTEFDLHQAVQLSQLELHYQPVVSATTQEIEGVEALMRWRHPKRGLLYPSEFIPMAEQNGAIVQMGAWALIRACTDAADLPDHIKLMVNVSARQFDAGDLAASVSKALSLSRLPASRLELEVTESVVLRETPQTLAALRDLKNLGVSIALDDFGKAFSSLNYLTLFDFDKIKIDSSFLIEGPDKDPGLIMEMIALMARRMNILTVAEGVETPLHLLRAQGAGCDQAQGFYFSMPITIDRLKILIGSSWQRSLIPSQSVFDRALTVEGSANSTSGK